MKIRAPQVKIVITEMSLPPLVFVLKNQKCRLSMILKLERTFAGSGMVILGSCYGKEVNFKETPFASFIPNFCQGWICCDSYIPSLNFVTYSN